MQWRMNAHEQAIEGRTSRRSLPIAQVQKGNADRCRRRHRRMVGKLKRGTNRGIPEAGSIQILSRTRTHLIGSTASAGFPPVVCAICGFLKTTPKTYLIFA